MTAGGSALLDACGEVQVLRLRDVPALHGVNQCVVRSEPLHDLRVDQLNITTPVAL